MTRNRLARHRRLLAELDQHATLRVSELAGRLRVSAETVRRDLDELTEQGLVARTYGGAIRRRALEPDLEIRHTINVAERQAIARLACPILAGASHVLVGSGATTAHVARRMAAELDHLTVMTHAVAVAAALAGNTTLTVVLAGGVYLGSEGAVHGAATVASLEGVRADWAVLGASGLDDQGPSDALLEAGEVYAAMVRRARRTMVVADGSKFDKSFPAAWARWGDVDVLVTDREPPAPIREALSAARVTCVTPSP